MSVKVSTPNPVATYVISEIEKEFPELSEEAKDEASSIVYRLFDRCISFEESIAAFDRLSIGHSQIMMIKSILSTLENNEPAPLPDESSDDCQVSTKRCRMWKKEEDIVLLAGIIKYGVGDWKRISAFVGGGRTRSQCSQRWGRALNPKIAKVPWEKAEERVLLDLVAEFGEHSWATVSKKLGTRSDVQCRYRYYQILKSQPRIIDTHISPLVNNKARMTFPSVSELENRPSAFPPIHALPFINFINHMPIRSYNSDLSELIPPLKPRVEGGVTNRAAFSPLSLKNLIFV